MNDREKRLAEIEENLKDHIDHHSTDCDEADDYRRDVPWLITELRAAWEREKELQESNEVQKRAVEAIANQFLQPLQKDAFRAFNRIEVLEKALETIHDQYDPKCEWTKSTSEWIDELCREALAKVEEMK